MRYTNQLISVKANNELVVLTLSCGDQIELTLNEAKKLAKELIKEIRRV